MAQQDRRTTDSRLQFSSNRGGARHRVRYVESSAPEPGECSLCVGSLADTPPPQVIIFFGPLRDKRPLPMQCPAR